MKKLLIIAYLITFVLPQTTDAISIDNFSFDKELLLKAASSDLEDIIRGNIEYDKEKYFTKIFNLETKAVLEELESIINTDQIIIEFIPNYIEFIHQKLKQDYFDSNTIDSIVYKMIDFYKGDDSVPIESGLFCFVMPIFSEEAIEVLQLDYIQYKTQYPNINENELYINYINENNIINNKNDISSNIIDVYTSGLGMRDFDIYVDNGFSYGKQKIIKNIIISMYPEMEGCNNADKKFGNPDCIEFITTNIDSLQRAQDIEAGITSISKEKIYDKSFAIIIGINDYENISNLDYAVNDAESVKEMLINQFSYEEENVKLLINEDANKDNIEQAISDVSLEAGENDRILVFFAGHGETMSLPDGGEMGYLLPVDGRQENLYASAIPMNDLKDLSNMSKAKHMLFLVDACYGGLAAVGTRGLEPAKTPNYLEKITNIKARQIITAGGSTEKVIEKPEWGHSAYTMNLLRALKDGLADANGDGYITAGELGLYLHEKVTIDSENQQTPQSRRLTSHEGEFIFFQNP